MLLVGQTGKYAVRAEDLPRASKLSCAQQPTKSAEFENVPEKHAILYGEAMRGGFFQTHKCDGEKYLPRAENKLSSLAYGCCTQARNW